MARAGDPKKNRESGNDVVASFLQLELLTDVDVKGTDARKSFTERYSTTVTSFPKDIVGWPSIRFGVTVEVRKRSVRSDL
jgi:hypothetical protein